MYGCTIAYIYYKCRAMYYTFFRLALICYGYIYLYIMGIITQKRTSFQKKHQLNPLGFAMRHDGFGPDSRKKSQTCPDKFKRDATLAGCKFNEVSFQRIRCL